MKFMQDGTMTAMSQEAQLAAIAATLDGMKEAFGRELRDIKDDFRQARSSHEAEITDIKKAHASDIARLEERLTVERERMSKWENRGAGLLLGIGALASTLGAVSAIVWKSLFGSN